MPQQQVKTFRHLASLRAGVACLQEMHFTHTSTPRFFHTFYPQVHTASDQVRKRGVLIAFHMSMRFTCDLRIADLSSRYLLLRGTVQDQPATILSFYAPNVDQVPFLRHLLGGVVEHHRQYGDSNLTLKPLVDQSPSPHMVLTSCQQFSALLE